MATPNFELMASSRCSQPRVNAHARNVAAPGCIVGVFQLSAFLDELDTCIVQRRSALNPSTAAIEGRGRKVDNEGITAANRFVIIAPCCWQQLMHLPLQLQVRTAPASHSARAYTKTGRRPMRSMRKPLAA